MVLTMPVSIMDTCEYVHTERYHHEMTARLTREASRQRTRALLLDAAARVFARRGYRGATLDEIAAEAGFSKGAVYSNFESKEELFFALLERRRAEQDAELARAPQGTPGASTADLGRLAAPVDLDAWEWGLLTLEFFLYAAREHGVRERLAADYRAERSAVAELLVRRRPAATATRLEPAELATITMALATGLGVQAALDPDAIPLDLHARTLRLLLGDVEGERP